MFVWLDFFLPTYSNLLRFPFFMKLAHRHLFAVLFSFQRTIALSDLINIAYSLSSVKLLFHSSKANALCIISVCFPFVKHFFCLYFYSFHFFLSHILQLVFLYFYTTIFCMQFLFCFYVIVESKFNEKEIRMKPLFRKISTQFSGKTTCFAHSV